MSHYERRYGYDWDALDRDDATERAYALGVAERLGERDRDELERIYTAMSTNYDRSLVEVAFEEGRNEARELARAADEADPDPWEQLVEGESVVFDPRDRTGGREGLPEALEPSELLDKLDVDSRDATDRPGFLDR